MTDDDPLDLAQVGADDAALDAVVAGRVADDLALVLLRDLLEDVGEEPSPVAAGCGSTVLSLAGDRTPDRRTLRNGTMVAALTAGLLSLSGVAAASTLAPAGTPLHGLGEVVRSAVGAAVGSVTPPDPVAPAPAAPAQSSAPRTTSTAPAGTATAPAGAAVSAAARSQAAARQVSALLDAADVLLREGRADAASARLDSAERRLTDVLAVGAAPLAERLAALREQVAAATARADEPARERQAPSRPAPREQAPQQQRPKQQAGQDPPPKADRGKEQSRSDRSPRGRGESPRGSARTGEPAAPQVGDLRPQLSRDASTKPRA